jgi:hypothetical protein
MVHDRAHHAATLGDPMMLRHPHGGTDRDTLWLHEDTPAAWRHDQGLVGFEGELLVSLYLSVVEVVGAAADDLLRLFFRRLQGRVPPEQVLSHYGAKRFVVLGF